MGFFIAPFVWGVYGVLTMSSPSVPRRALLGAEGEAALARRIEAARDAAAELESAAEAGRDLPTAERRALDALVADGKEAHHAFVEANLGLVHHVARRFRVPDSMEFEDLVAEGIIGLHRAVDGFEWRRGFKFSTYATWWIRQAIGRAIEHQAGTIRVPAKPAAKVRNALAEAGGDPMLLSPEHYAIHQLGQLSSIDDTETFGVSVSDRVADAGTGVADAVTDQIGRETVREVVSELTPNLAEAVRLRFGFDGGDGLSYAEIGRRLDVSEGTARNWVVSGIDKLRDAPELVAA